MKNISALILAGFLLVACQPKLPANPTFFDSPVCQPPCWENITPGVTTKKDALTILSEIDSVDQPVLDPNYPNTGFDDTIHFSAYGGKDNFVGG